MKAGTLGGSGDFISRLPDSIRPTLIMTESCHLRWLFCGLCEISLSPVPWCRGDPLTKQTTVNCCLTQPQGEQGLQGP